MKIPLSPFVSGKSRQSDIGFPRQSKVSLSGKLRQSLFTVFTVGLFPTVKQHRIDVRRAPSPPGQNTLFDKRRDSLSDSSAFAAALGGECLQRRICTAGPVVVRECGEHASFAPRQICGSERAHHPSAWRLCFIIGLAIFGAGHARTWPPSLRNDAPALNPPDRGFALFSGVLVGPPDDSQPARPDRPLEDPAVETRLARHLANRCLDRNFRQSPGRAWQSILGFRRRASRCCARRVLSAQERCRLRLCGRRTICSDRSRPELRAA